MSQPNIIVFGETGVGKSSIINMLDGSGKADVSSSAAGVSIKDICYKKTIKGETFNVFDTAGLNEGRRGTVTPRVAIEMLHNLICRLDDGISLLIFVMRAPRVTATAHQIYKMFYEIVCQKNIPIVIVITHLEFEPDMDVWFDNNREVFRKQEMTFEGNACITTIKIQVEGRANAYEKSKEKVEQVILNHAAKEPLKMSRQSWFAEAVLMVIDIFGFTPSDLDPSLLDLVKSCGGLSNREAKTLVRKIRRTAKKNRDRDRGS